VIAEIRLAIRTRQRVEIEEVPAVRTTRLGTHDLTVVPRSAVGSTRTA
jgi:hypothetical protein